jgi:hypothetical protein
MKQHGVWVLVAFVLVMIAGTFVWLSHVKRIDQQGYHYR